MNYNANTGARQPFGRKVKRVSDVNSMGYNPYEQSNLNSQTQNLFPSLDQDANSFQAGIPYDSPTFPTTPNVQSGSDMNYNQSAYPNITPVVPDLGVLNTPIVQNMAMQYGQQLTGAGKTLIKNEVERIVPVSKLKYYFAVDTGYVTSKLLLLFFPFTHKDWSVKFEQDGPVQPRFEINAPDLYLPSMAYITYVLVAGLVLGMQHRFSPEQIGILASSALAWCFLEILIYTCTLYIIQVETSLHVLDLLAYAGYKFVGTIISILASLVGGRTGYYSCLVYFNLALAFFLVRSLKVQVLTGGTQDTSYYGASQATSGRKRRLYFLLFVAGIQPLLSWWLSYHLVPTELFPVPENSL